MLLPVQPSLPEPGVPALPDMERYEEGMAGLGVDWGWITGTADKILEKVQLPGFGTPKYAPGTVISTPEGTAVRQETGYPVTVPQRESTTGFEFSTGAGVMLAGAAVFVGLMFLSRGGKK